LKPDHEVPDTLVLSELVAQSADYALMRPSLITALGVTEDDFREWERSSSVPPKIEAISLDEEDGDFEVAPPRGGETEFILDDPEAEEDEDEDSEPEDGDDEDSDDEDDESEDDDQPEDEDDEDQDDPDADEEFGDGEGLDDDDVILEDDDGERD